MKLPLYGWLSLMLIAVTYGALSYRWGLFPSPLLKKALAGYQEVSSSLNGSLPWGYGRIEAESSETTTISTQAACEGMNLITRMAKDNGLVVELVSPEGGLVKQWSLDWFDLWPDATHLPEHIIPKSRPGTFIHGVVLLPDGSIVFNYEYCGMVRVDKDSKVMWKLPYATHHSLHLAEDGNLWACGLVFDDSNKNQKSGCELIERQMIVEVSQTGELLNEWSVEDLMINSGLKGYLFLMKRKCDEPQLLHLNDVEPISMTDSSSWFQEGDVLFSLRNVNAVFVFNRFTNHIREDISGHFIAQHDPDIKNGGSITVFDNGNAANTAESRKSRIVEIDLRTGNAQTVIEGNEDLSFYSEKLGKHQWLSNGNLLITSSQQGRAFEVTASGEVVWEYFNKLSDESFGYLIDVQRVPLSHAQVFQ